jgi:anti-anti-sigma regulatory factor
MSIALSHAENSSLICIDGAAGIASAVELKAALLKALEAGKEVHINLEKAMELDVTTYQLLWAAEQQAKQSGLQFAIIGPLPVAMQNPLKEIGLDDFSELQTHSLNQ